MRKRLLRFALPAALLLATVAVATPQLRQVIKAIGVGAAIAQFGPDIDRGFDRLTKHKDTELDTTKVVPILTIGLVGTKGAIGAAQVKGAKKNVDRVKAVASPEADLFGREFRLRALIPVDSVDVSSMDKIRPVDGVGVSGIVDLKL